MYGDSHAFTLFFLLASCYAKEKQMASLLGSLQKSHSFSSDKATSRKERLMKNNLARLLLLCLLLSICVGCSAQADEYTKFSMSFFGTFDTVVTIIGYAKEKATFDRVAKEARSRFERLHQVYDAYNAYEGIHNLYFMNKEAAKAPVAVEPELMALLQYCTEKQPQTNGKVNIALGAVLSLWHACREEAEYDPPNAMVPLMEQLQEAAQHVDMASLVLNPEKGTVYFNDPALRIDLGAVAKGYAAEQVAQWMLTSDMPSFIIDAGGNVRAGKHPEDGRNRWGVSIQNPNEIALGSPSDKDLDVLFVSNLSVVTSGDYQRYFTVDGVRYHHIISPDTLMPSNEMRSITVVCEDSGWADILSTMLFITPFEEGLAFVESQEGLEAYWVLVDSSIHMSSGMQTIAKSMGAKSSDPI